jgi:carbonic anhydrase
MSTKSFDAVLEANNQYARNFGEKSKLAMPPARHFAILTCMDARLDPAKYAGLAEGDAHVIRNAGGRATDDAIRSLVISHKLLGDMTWRPGGSTRWRKQARPVGRQLERPHRQEQH